MNDAKHDNPEVVPLHHREVEKPHKKHHALSQTPLDTTPDKHISYSSEPHHVRVKRNKLGTLTGTLLLVILFLALASVFATVFFSMWISNKYKQLPPHENITPTPKINGMTPMMNDKIISITPMPLSQDEKELIDIWLADNRKIINNFGDQIDMTYRGGTPLFDESSERTIDRYDYIVTNHPDRPWNN